MVTEVYNHNTNTFTSIKLSRISVKQYRQNFVQIAILDKKIKYSSNIFQIKHNLFTLQISTTKYSDNNRKKATENNPIWSDFSLIKNKARNTKTKNKINAFIGK